MAHTNHQIETLAQQADPVQTTVRLPGELWEALKAAAARERRPAQEIHIAALRQYLKLPTN